MFKQTLKRLIGVTALVTSQAGFASNSDSWKITRLLDSGAENRFVVLESSSGAHLSQGSKVITQRVLSPQGSLGKKTIKVETGTLQIERSERDYAIARIIEDGSTLSKAAFPSFPGIMTGDHVEILRPKIVSNKVINKDVSMSYFDLFIDPKASPSTYEVSDAGLEELIATIKEENFSTSSRILIEGHTDRKGSSKSNQVESYQRALAIKQVIIDHLGFKPTSIIALGLGEGELVDNSYVSGFDRRNRRIVIKTISNDAFKLREVY